MSRFQAIDNSNCVIENIQAGEKPQTLEGAAQAWVQKFEADYTDFEIEALNTEWVRQETEMLMNQYDVPRMVAYTEAVERLQAKLGKSVGLVVSH